MSERGILFPPHVRVTKWHPIGKETNELEAREVGLLGTREATNAYREPDGSERERLLDAMNKLGVERLWNEAKTLSERHDAPPGRRPMAKSTLRDVLRGRTHATGRHWRFLEEAARRAMRGWLRTAAVAPERSSLDGLTDQFLSTWESLVVEPSARYDNALHNLAVRHSGRSTEVAHRAGISRQHLRRLCNAERRAAVVRLIDDLDAL